MPQSSSPRLALRDATAACHERVDAVFSQANLADADGYGRFLIAQAAAHLPVEAALEAGGIGTVVADWPDRRRAALIRADLAALERDLPPAVPFHLPAGVPALLGAAYVLEGSRLGGALLRRSVAPGLPTGFLAAPQAAGWRVFVRLLDARLVTEEAVAAAITAARAVFARFEDSGRKHLANESLVGGR